MDYRKLIKLGSSSHILTLPNDWLKKNKLKKGDLVYISENINNELILSPQLKEEKKGKQVTITENNDLDDLNRKLISAYISGYDIVNIKLKNLNNFRVIENYLDSLMSFEIIEQTPNEIIAKDLLDIKEISMEKIIRRIDILIRAMIEETKESHKLSNYEDVYKRDQDINKLAFLSFRIIKKCFEYPKLTEYIGVKYNKLIDEWMLVFYLEKMADEVKRISRYLTRSKDKSNKLKEIISLYLEVYEDYKRCMDAYYKKDINTAYEMSKRKDIVMRKSNSLLEKNKDPYVFNIIDRTKALANHIRDISRLIYQ